MAELFQLPTEDSKSQFIPETSLGKTIDFAQIAAVREKTKAFFDEIAPRICKQYGVSSEFEVKQIFRAEQELAQCVGCSGTCQKRDNRWLKPVIKVSGGELRIPYCKCEHGERLRLRRECGAVKIPEKFIGKTFDDYQITPDNRQAVKIARWFANDKPSTGLYIFGECGTGKTFLASIIAQEFIRDFKTLAFGDVPSLLDEIKRTFDGDGNAADVMKRYSDCDLLVLDDIGAGQITEWNVGVLYQIINDRYARNKPVIATSNFDIDGLKRRLTVRDDYNAKRITSRLSEICTLAFLGTNDRRLSKC